MSCSAVFCSSRTTIRGEKNPELSFHAFPKCPDIRNQWIKAVRREQWEPTKYSRLCSKHFENSCFVPGLSIRKLKTDSIPTIFEGYPKYYQPVARKRKPQLRDGELEMSPRKIQKIVECGIQPRNFPTTPNSVFKVIDSLSKSRKVASRRLRLVKSLRETKRRIMKKNAQLLNIVADLKKKHILDVESLNLLSSIGEQNRDLLLRLKLKNNKQPLPKQYSPELRKFALTLHFLSPRAYRYVRTHFNTCLPHPKTITRWYQGVDCEPGFTKEAFEALKLKSQNQTIIGALTIDEMAIRKCVQWDGNRSHGYVNVGTNVEGDIVPVATEALVFMVTCVNGSFKIPVGYFLINGISGLQKAELVRSCLDLLTECNVSIVTITFDGAPNNLAMAVNLGCNLDGPFYSTA